MNDVAARYTSRKFWAMVVWEAVMVWLLWSGKLPVDAFVSLTWLLLGGYFASNVIQNVAAEKINADVITGMKAK